MASAAKTRRPTKNRKGTLIVIGGHEDKVNEMKILKEVASHVKHSKLVLATLASNLPDEVWQSYKKLFAGLGVKKIVHLDIFGHEDSHTAEKLAVLDGAKAIFFTGGDQLKITTKIGGTPLFKRISEIYNEGGVIVGTSAGASIMGKIMLMGGENAETHKVGNWMMAPGLGFVDDIIVDQHFAQRGRVGRLIGAVAQNPGVVGVGIDEDTSIIIKNDKFRVLGANAVYIVDGRFITGSNVSEAAADKTMSAHDIRLHILSEGEGFDILTRKILMAKDKAED